jgi:hypothetical protein
MLAGLPRQPDFRARTICEQALDRVAAYLAALKIRGSKVQYAPFEKACFGELPLRT